MKLTSTPRGVVEVDLPLLSVDRQMGLVIVTPEGKVSAPCCSANYFGLT